MDRKRLALAVMFCISTLCAGPGAPLFGQSNRDLGSVVRDNARFAIDLYGQIETGEGNLFLSPYSTSVALAMTFAGEGFRDAAHQKKVGRDCG